MNKIRVIDLLNKIANGEEVPDNIKYDGIDYYWCNSCKIYERIEDGRNDLYNDIDNLNDEVEILEEEKKIPEKIEYYDDSIAWVIDDVGQLSDVDKVIIDKLNEVIDCIKMLENK